MKQRHVNLLLAVGTLAVFTVTACGLSAPSAPDSATEPPAASEVPATSTFPPEPSPVLVQHQSQPATGTTAVANAHDNEQSATFEERSINGGDEFRLNRFERPFTANEMLYVPQVDIVGMSMTKDADWYYVQIKLVGADGATGEMNGIYGVEFDLNVDGKTEVLVLAQGPLTSEWTTDGVTVYADANGDIGGLSSKPDDIYAGDGYETIIFDNGQGEDPDLSWARANADNAIVEIAFKQAVLRDYPRWMWNPLASLNPLDPTKFYFNDTMTPERAGSPMKGDANYPLKELAAFDNTCRVPAGFEATGGEPMGCNVAQQKDLSFEGYPQ